MTEAFVGKHKVLRCSKVLIDLIVFAKAQPRMERTGVPRLLGKLEIWRC